jgi:hypothetical protein
MGSCSQTCLYSIEPRCPVSHDALRAVTEMTTWPVRMVRTVLWRSRPEGAQLAIRSAFEHCLPVKQASRNLQGSRESRVAPRTTERSQCRMHDLPQSK